MFCNTEKAHAGCQIGSHPFFKEGRVGADLVIRSTDQAVLAACEADLAARLEAHGRELVRGRI